MTTIVLADDHALVREGLRTVLGGQGDWSVVGEAADGMEAVALAEQLQPDVLIVDLMLPGLSEAWSIIRAAPLGEAMHEYYFRVMHTCAHRILMRQPVNYDQASTNQVE